MDKKPIDRSQILLKNNERLQNQLNKNPLSIKDQLENSQQQFFNNKIIPDSSNASNHRFQGIDSISDEDRIFLKKLNQYKASRKSANQGASEQGIGNDYNGVGTRNPNPNQSIDFQNFNRPINRGVTMDMLHQIQNRYNQRSYNQNKPNYRNDLYHTMMNYYYNI